MGGIDHLSFGFAWMDREPVYANIGMGGIEKWQDAIEMMMAGANAIQIGAAMFYNPKAPIEVIDGMNQWLEDNHISDINEIVGTVQPW